MAQCGVLIIWRELGFSPENTLHDLRLSQHYRGNGVDDYVWVLSHFRRGAPARISSGLGG